MQGLTRTASADKKCGGGKAPDYLCAKAATTVARCERCEQPQGRRGGDPPTDRQRGGGPRGRDALQSAQAMTMRPDRTKRGRGR